MAPILALVSFILMFLMFVVVPGMLMKRNKAVE